MNEYWQRRKGYAVYNRIRDIINDFPNFILEDATILDVGSGESDLVDEFDDFKYRMSIDPGSDYSGEGRYAHIMKDYMECDFTERVNVILCLQVMEHLREPERFGKKLYKEAENVLIVSVPYKWAGDTVGHIQDPIDTEKFLSWFPGLPSRVEYITEKPTYITRMLAIFEKDVK